jgi:hypothetical protein
MILKDDEPQQVSEIECDTASYNKGDMLHHLSGGGGYCLLSR